MDYDFIPTDFGPSIEEELLEQYRTNSSEPVWEKENELQDFINSKLQFDKWKKAKGQFTGCIGECTIVQHQRGIGHFKADLTIWDPNFDDPKLIVSWLKEIGVAFVTRVAVEIYNCDDMAPENQRTIKGHRIWLIDFSL